MVTNYQQNHAANSLENKIHEYIKNNLQVYVSTSGSDIVVETYLNDELIHTSSCKGPAKPILPLY